MGCSILAAYVLQARGIYERQSQWMQPASVAAAFSVGKPERKYTLHTIARFLGWIKPSDGGAVAVGDDYAGCSYGE